MPLLVGALALGHALAGAIAVTVVLAAVGAVSQRSPSTRSRSARALRGLMLGQRGLALAVQVVPLVWAARSAPVLVAAGSSLAVAAAVVARRRGASRAAWLHAITGVLLVTNAVTLDRYFRQPRAECLESYRTPGAKVLVPFVEPEPGTLGVPVARCLEPRTIRVDGDGSLWVGCTPTLAIGAAGASSFLHVQPDRPREWRGAADRWAYAVLPLADRAHVAATAPLAGAVDVYERATLNRVESHVVECPAAMMLDGARGRVLVARGSNGPAPALVALDASTLERVAASASVGPGCVGDALVPIAGGEQILLTCPQIPYQLLRFRAADLALVEARIGWGARDALRSQDGRTLLVALPFVARVRQLDAATSNPIGSFPVPFGTVALAWAPDGDLLAGSYWLGVLAKLDPTTHEERGRIALGRKVRDVVRDGTSDRVYAVSRCGLFEIGDANVARVG